MLVRPYAPEDRAQVIALWHECGLVVVGANDPEADIDLCIGQSNADILVGELNGQVVATAMVGVDGHRGWLYYVAVDPAHQGKGLGRRIVGEAEGWLTGHGAPKSQLMIRAGNAAVEAFYAKLGYVTVPRIVMQKRF